MKTKMKDDLEDIPMAYLWYVVVAILAIVAAAVAVVIRLFSRPLRFVDLTFRSSTDCAAF